MPKRLPRHQCDLQQRRLRNEPAVRKHYNNILYLIFDNLKSGCHKIKKILWMAHEN